MRMLRVRFTVWRLMALVLLAALALTAREFVLEVLYGDELFCAQESRTETWAVGPSPEVTIDLADGDIFVVGGSDGEVAAEISTFAVMKGSQAAADRALTAFVLEAERRDERVRIVSKGVPFFTNNQGARIMLAIPPGTRLDLRTGGWGAIWVGRDPDGGASVRPPLDVRSIRARNQTEMQAGRHGDIIVETARRPSDSVGIPGAMVLRLVAGGKIEIRADDVIVDARARGLENGSITFDGTLAEGAHAFHAVNRVVLCTSSDAAFRAEAEAVNGGILVDGIAPNSVTSQGKRTRWEGSIGMNPQSLVWLLTDDGSITIERRP